MSEEKTVHHIADLKNSEGHTRLHLAAKYGNLELARELLAQGASVNLRNFQANGSGTTALHLACHGGHLEIARLLIEAGAEVNAQCHYWIDVFTNCITPLTLAAQQGHTTIVIELATARAAVFGIGNCRSSAVHIAAGYGHCELLEHLLQAYEGSANIRDAFQMTPLHYAAENGHIDTTLLLLRNGAQVDARDIGACTPLHKAAEGGHVDIFNLLIEAGADPLALCEEWDDVICSPDLSTDNCTYNVLHLASKYGHANIAARALQLGVDINSTADQSTALHIAAYDPKRNEVLKVLVATSGIDIDAVGPIYDTQHLSRMLDDEEEEEEATGSYTALHIACDLNLEAVCSLVAAGADVNRQDNAGYTPLHYLSCWLDNVDKSPSTNHVQRKPDTRKYSLEGRKSEYRAAMRALNAKSNVDAASDAGLTPLHCACDACNVEAVELLVKEGGANVHVRSGSEFLNGFFFNSGLTPLHFLARAPPSPKQLEIVKLLQYAGADINAIDEDGNTPLHYFVLPRHLLVALGLYGKDVPSAMDKNVLLSNLQMHNNTLHYILSNGADACMRNYRGETSMKRLKRKLEMDSTSILSKFEKNASIGYALHSLFATLVKSGDFSWDAVPNPCFGLERALVPVWQRDIDGVHLRQLFHRLQPKVKEMIRNYLFILYQTPLTKDTRMLVLEQVLNLPVHLGKNKKRR